MQYIHCNHSLLFHYNQNVIDNKLEQASHSEKIVTHASITAKGFFEKRGYKIVAKQQVERQGILLTNYVMER